MFHLILCALVSLRVCFYVTRFIELASTHSLHKRRAWEYLNTGRREINQQDATNPMFIIKLLYQHVSGIIMPIIRRTRRCITTYGVLHWLCWLWLCGAGSSAVCTVWKPNSNFHTVHTAYDTAPHNHSQHNQCRTPYAVIHGLVLLMMDIMMPETCWDRSLIINIRLVASCWFISLHPTFHDARSQETKISI